jgi:hypothetical protein
LGAARRPVRRRQRKVMGVSRHQISEAVFPHSTQVRMNDGPVFIKELTNGSESFQYRGGKKNKIARSASAMRAMEN